MEIWKDIKGYEGLYQASNYGRIKSLKRYVNTTFGKRLVKERILKNNKTKNGYYTVNLGLHNSKSVHRLILETFVPINKKMDVMHLDNDRSNNKLTNLKWGTRSDNLQQMVREGRWKNQFAQGSFYE